MGDTVDPNVFRNPADKWQTLRDFMAFCHIIRSPNFEPGVLS